MDSKAPIPYDVSVILTAHSEGRLAHRSVKSARRAVRFAQQRGVEVELIAVLDSASQETTLYFEEQKQLFNHISRVDFRDRGLSRNHGVDLASGRYVSFLDADDLYSENWIESAFRFAAEHPTLKLVLHPALNIYFGRDLLLLPHVESTSTDYAPLNLLEFNYWTALSFVARHLFLKGNQYIAINLSQGFGHEDWWWNCETVANGALHRIVPQTVHFIRQEVDGSRHQLRDQARAVFPPTKLFGDTSPYLLRSDAGERVNDPICTQTDSKPASTVYRIKNSGLDLIRSRPRLLRFCKGIAVATEELLAAAPPPLPEWLVAEWRRIHEIEPELFPSREALENINRGTLPKSTVAGYYPELHALVSPSPTHVFLVPWLKAGGAEVEAIHYMTAVVKEDNGSRVVCIITGNVDSTWRDKLPKEVKIVEFGKFLSGLSAGEQAQLLLRLLLQKNPEVIHNVNSALGYKLFAEHGLALAAQSSLFATIFAEEILPDGKVSGYAFTHLPLCIDYLSGVFADNQRIIDKLCDIYAFERKKFSVFYAPAPMNLNLQNSKPNNGSLDVLWASRLDIEKRPDVLVRIASELVGLPIHFHVYGSSVFNPERPEVIRNLAALPNVTTYGRYDGFKSIPTTLYDLFLYTSERDGLPNVLLEAISAGLPVIAPNVGGIKELIDDNTGFLASHAEAVDEYVEFLKKILDDHRVVVPKVEAAKALVETRHSWNSFVSKLRQVPGYFAGAPNDNVLRNQSSRSDA